MADARLRSEWLGQMRFLDLSDAAWRVFTSALMWSVENGTDGAIPARHLRYLHPDGVRDDANAEITAAGLWTATENGYQLEDWAGALGQSTAQQIESYRTGARDRQRRRRERQKAAEAAPDTTEGGSVAQAGAVTPDVERDVTRDVTANVGLGLGKGRREEARARTSTCRRHPSWDHDEPCMACKRDREAAEAAAAVKLPSTMSPRILDCGPGNHTRLQDGTCTRCENRDPQRGAA
ncbi:hypothetical protein [Microbacterium marinilacus]|uniref:Uncharacterized protein n=1 Tax=Microbacterium marinilacus TaxID=415209 RepID=A0ABP7BAB3_9MICO|nr:hypothetical protein [Microbacterium marinilacus]MBY0687009.1 hypothetical protein [Microbacterium marinilacus]